MPLPQTAPRLAGAERGATAGEPSDKTHAVVALGLGLAFACRSRRASSGRGIATGGRACSRASSRSGACAGGSGFLQCRHCSNVYLAPICACSIFSPLLGCNTLPLLMWL